MYRGSVVAGEWMYGDSLFLSLVIFAGFVGVRRFFWQGQPECRRLLQRFLVLNPQPACSSYIPRRLAKGGSKEDLPRQHQAVPTIELRLCHVMSCHVMSCRVMLCHFMSCHLMSSHDISCHVMSCHVMSCHGILCDAMSRVDACMCIYSMYSVGIQLL